MTVSYDLSETLQQSVAHTENEANGTTAADIWSKAGGRIAAIEKNE